MGLIESVTSLYLEAKNRQMYGQRIDEPFDFIGLMLSRKCFANCIFCPVHRMRFKNNFMSIKVYRRIIGQLSTFKGFLNFGENGDALLHPMFRYMFRSARKDTDAKLVLYSNMGNMGISMSKFVLSNGLSHLTLNMDGASAITYESSKRGLRYPVIKKNLERFIELRDSINPSCAISISIIPPVRYHEMRGDGSTGLRYDVEAIVSHWKPLLKKGDSITEASYFYNWANPPSRRRSIPCPMMEQLFHKLYINVDGHVYPCCLDYRTSLTYGNVMDESLRSIWNSERRKGIITRILEMDWNGMSPCSTCNEPNDIIESKLNQMKHRLLERGKV
jgi:radical SAM protein with 4Fe4S-binding SPASM domain